MPTLRDAETRDLPAIRTVLARAYHPNPLMTWVFPDAATRDEACAAWLAPSLERYLSDGVVHVVETGGTVVAVAAWIRAGASSTPRPATLPTSAGVLAALVGQDRAVQVRSALRSSAPLFPSGPSAYLNYLGVDPGLQGTGLGARLVRHGLAVLTDAGNGAHLGTTDPGNVGFYTALGFTSAGTVLLDEPGPSLEILVRAPAQPVAQRPDGDPEAGSAGSANHTRVSP
ncbi:GNAT family N-acetyltransferase [Cellulomonas soli]|uniref:N-acetyltransferase domain-containing protein n=1 Tax=Cellulomonas soli TaxID=931535 RepID=A0A512PDN0_9CELL|nr:GNAT family N-acetyltransferase [Cellulomonas soli]NYI60029.1 ribosomal protein S18 acetylase RimI-like enzyme [Cellulomonas soli]GEP69317.1 hypothetical protein CSO01_20320 [Cellulomonas soli]